MLGTDQGLQGAALNAGNHASIRRMFADGCIRPMWRRAAGALQSIVQMPPGGPARLWYDDRDVSFLKEDMKDFATVQQADATTVNTLITAGYDADAVIDAVTTGDLTILKGKHSGLPSVQLQQGQPGAVNGNANGKADTANPPIAAA